MLFIFWGLGLPVFYYNREDDEDHTNFDDTTEGATRLVEAISASSEVESHQNTVPSVAQIGRQHSIVRATGMSETVRSAALKARHRVRATTVGSTVRRTERAGGQEPLAEEEARGDTDEETNEGTAYRITSIMYMAYRFKD